MFKGLQWKIVLLYSSLILFALLLIGVYLVQSLENYYMRNFIEGVETQAKLLSNFLSPRIYDDEGEEHIADIVEGFRGTRDFDIVVLDRNSRVIGTSGSQDMLGKRIIQEEVTKALAGNPKDEIRINPNNEQRYYYLAHPVTYEDMIVGVIYLSSSLHNIDQTLREIKGYIISGSAVVLIISFTIGMVLTRTITSPIREVTQKSEQLAQGDFSQRITAYSEDEIGQLVNMYNYLASRLQSTLEEISEEKSKVEAILNYMRDGVIALDASGVLIHINPAAQELLTSLGEEPLQIGKPPRFLLDHLIGNYALDEFYREGTPLTFETTWEDPYRVLRVNLAPFQVEEGMLRGMLVVLQDITREKEMIHRQQEFVANVSHELKTPLTSIKSYVETLLDEALDDKEVAYRFLQVVDNETERMVSLVKDLLTLSKLDAQADDFIRSQVYLQDVLEEVITNTRLYNSQGPEIELNIQEDLSPVYADRSQINQVFVNLLTNAVQYTSAEGRVEVVTVEEDGWIYACIRDTGIGIPEEEIPRVFERFYRVDKTRSRDYGGTGLGLSITRQVVESHGGKIWIESELDEGTAVWIALPAYLESESEQDGTAAGGKA